MCGRILIVDDEKDIVSFIKDSLTYEGYEVITAYDGEEAINKVRLKPDLILLDIMMPGRDGYEVCKEIRDIVSCPVIFLSARQEETDKVKGLAIGGDDYMVKPFSLRELKARINAHLRREKRSVSNPSPPRLYFGEISIDLSGRGVYFKNENISMTKREFDIIELLCLHPGQVFSKEQIYEKIWGYDAEGDSSNITEHVKKIRSKLSSFSPDVEYITTVWGVGYKWEKFNR